MPFFLPSRGEIRLLLILAAGRLSWKGLGSWGSCKGQWLRQKLLLYFIQRFLERKARFKRNACLSQAVRYTGVVRNLWPHLCLCFTPFSCVLPFAASFALKILCQTLPDIFHVGNCARGGPRGWLYKMHREEFALCLAESWWFFFLL